MEMVRDPLSKGPKVDDTVISQLKFEQEESSTMVQLMSGSSSGKRPAAAVKLEVEDQSVEDQLAPLHKRRKPCGLIDKPSPLGLQLKKTSSFLDLIQTKLSQEKTSHLSTVIGKKVHKEKGGSGTSVTAVEKIKASNFPASLIRIGTWQYKSRYKGDLVAKCYYAKHKLVWEVLDGRLKNKIEIQWSDIVAIKASFPDDGLETLDVVLVRQPLFFRETNPQPRKHTLWQGTPDFTGGQASIHRRHILQCHHGFLGKHFEKLTQCDPRLHILSQQPENELECPYFDQKFFAIDLIESHKPLGLNEKEMMSNFPLADKPLPSGILSSSLNNEWQASVLGSPPVLSEGTSKPVSGKGIGNAATEVRKMPSCWDKLKLPGIHPSMAASEVVKHVRKFISEQMKTYNPGISGHNKQAQYLPSDSQLRSESDDQSLISRIDSLCWLLQKDHGTQSSQIKGPEDVVDRCSVAETDSGETDSGNTLQSQIKLMDGSPVREDVYRNGNGCEKAPAMPRKDSVGELLLNLPRIASLPQFLNNM